MQTHLSFGRHLGFPKVRNFTCLSDSEDQYASSCQISCRLVKPLCRYGQFLIIKDCGRPPSWIFKSCKFYLTGRFGGPICVVLPNFVLIGQTIAVFRFLTAILDLFHARLDDPRRVFGGLCHCAKFGWNRYGNFDNIQVFIFCALSLKMPIHTPKMGVLGGFDPNMGSTMNETPKRHFLARKDVV